MSSHVKLEQAAAKHGIKAIFGLEAYTAPMTMREDGNTRKWHMTMLAADLVGLNNLYAMVTTSWERDFYRWPTVLGDSFKSHSDGIIALSGCADSHLACTLLGGKGIEEGNYDAAVKVMLGYKRLLGDRYYLECQRFPGLERSRILNQQYALWSAEYGIPLAASSDVHYPHPEENEMQKILHAAGVASGGGGWLGVRHPPDLSRVGQADQRRPDRDRSHQEGGRSGHLEHRGDCVAMQRRATEDGPDSIPWYDGRSEALAKQDPGVWYDPDCWRCDTGGHTCPGCGRTASHASGVCLRAMNGMEC